MRVTYNPPPTPFRGCDWTAISDNYEGGDPVGYGATRYEAIEDLAEQVPGLCKGCGEPLVDLRFDRCRPCYREAKDVELDERDDRMNDDGETDE